MAQLSLDKTVTAIAAELPAAADLFRSKGINFCCGGGVSLESAAIQSGLSPDALLADLCALEAAVNRDAPEETDALIDHLLSRYHETHRREFDFLIPLAAKVERVHGDHPAAPIGLTEALTALRDDLSGHMAKEEQLLFPMMRRGGSPTIAQPIAHMRDEHDETVRILHTIEHVTHGLALYTGVRKLNDDLVSHMHLENAVLFPRFELSAAPAGT